MECNPEGTAMITSANTNWKKTYALIVGIEKYESPSAPPLNGPANDAIDFANWLLDREIPHENIYLFVSPLEENSNVLQKTKLKTIEAANKENIIRVINYNLLNEGVCGELLYVFWGGHGIITKSQETRRRLLFSDTDNINNKTLDFNSLLEALKNSGSNSGFSKQVYLIDTCADAPYTEHFQIVKLEQAGERFSSNRVRRMHEQFVLFASAEYEVAKNQAGTGSFSQAVMEELKNLPLNSLLPDMEELTRKVEAKLDAKGAPKPVFKRFWSGSEEEDLSSFYSNQRIDLRGICYEILAEGQMLTTNSITSLAEGRNLRVDDVYVSLGLVERKKLSKRQDDVSPEHGSDLYKETEITKTFEHNAFLEEVLRQKNSSKSQGMRIAIIGEPGAGKTTLLQRIAKWVYNEIEQSIVIWVSLADLQGQELEAYLYKKWLTAAARKNGKAEASDKLKDDFATEFTKGRVWLLLDGLDEISLASGKPLSEIVRQIRTSGSISRARIVLSCRINLWDSIPNALTEFDTYRTLDFSYPQQVEQFIRQWFGANVQEDQGQKLFHSLNEQGKERIRDLVKNPLRLALLCFGWSLREGKLPETKAELYEQFVTDLYEFKSKEFYTSPKERDQLNAKLAELSREAIDKENNRFLLRHEFVCSFLGHPNEKGSSFDLALKLGFLNKVGLDAERPREPVYSFVHPTFEEYFAALNITDWDFFLPRAHKNKPVKDADNNDNSYRIFESQWKEVILLWLGREKIEKEQLIQTLIDFEDGCKDFYRYRAYFIAAAGITELRHCSRADEIVRQSTLR